MTHPAKAIVASLLFSTVLCTNSFAQQSIVSLESVYDKNNSELLTHNTTPVAVNTNTKASFDALFPNATNPLWAAIGDNYYVSFLNNGRKANAVFTAKGKMNYCITDCSMENLPAFFSKTIKKEYACYNLLKGTEIHAYGTVVYQAVIENSTDFKTLKYTVNGIEEIGQMKKQ
jgi:hypothetical protein